MFDLDVSKQQRQQQLKLNILHLFKNCTKTFLKLLTTLILFKQNIKLDMTDASKKIVINCKI